MFPLFNPGFGRVVRSAAYYAFRQGARAYFAYQTRDFAAVEGENFIVKYTDQDQELVSLVLDCAEQYYQDIGVLLGRELPAGGKKVIVLHPDRESLHNIFGWGQEQRAVGVYWAGNISLLSPQVWLNEDGEGLSEAFLRENPLSHEIIHLLVDSWTQGNYPRWLSEGLAQYIEAGLIGYVLPEPEEEAREFLPLDKLGSAFDDPEKQLAAYWQSRLMVQHLADNYGLDGILELLDCLRQGSPVAAPFREIYGFSVEKLIARVAIIHRKNL